MSNIVIRFWLLNPIALRMANRGSNSAIFIRVASLLNRRVVGCGCMCMGVCVCVGGGGGGGGEGGVVNSYWKGFAIPGANAFLLA